MSGRLKIKATPLPLLFLNEIYLNAGFWFCPKNIGFLEFINFLGIWPKSETFIYSEAHVYIVRDNPYGKGGEVDGVGHGK